MLENLATSLVLLAGGRTPLWVTHLLTYRCNLDCVMCPIKLLPATTELDATACLDVQRDFRRHGTRVWGYSGGEPLLRPDLEELCAAARALGMVVTLSTNGVLLPHLLDLARMVDELEIAIDGDRESHDAVRGAGTFDQAVAGVEAVAGMESGQPGIVIKTLLTRRSIEMDTLNTMLDLADRWGARLRFSPSAAHRADDRLLDNASNHAPTAEQFLAFRQWLEAGIAGPRGRCFADDPAFFRALGAFPDFPRRIPCQAGRRHCLIDPAGQVLPCADLCDRPAHHLTQGRRFGRGHAGFRSLPCPYPCDQQYCYGAKANFLLGAAARAIAHMPRRKG